MTAPRTLYVGCPMWAQRAWVGRFLPDDTASGHELHVYSRLLHEPLTSRLRCSDSYASGYSHPGVRVPTPMVELHSQRQRGTRSGSVALAAAAWHSHPG